MNQTFKKKVIVASLASAFALIGAGVVNVPGMATMSVASANQFEATSIAVSGAISVAPSVNPVSLTGTTVTITESGTPVGSGLMVLRLSNSSSFTSTSGGIVSGSGISVTGGLTVQAVATSTTTSQSLTIGGTAFTYTPSLTTGTPDTITLANGTIVATLNRAVGGYASAAEVAATTVTAINSVFGAGTAYTSGAGASVVSINAWGSVASAVAVAGGGGSPWGTPALPAAATTNLGVGAAAGNGTNTTPGSANGYLYIPVAGAGTGTGKVTLRNLSAATGATAGAVNVYIDTSSTAVGLTTGSSSGATLTTIATAGTTAALGTGQVTGKALAGTTVTIPTFTITEAVAGAMNNGSSFTITAPAGMTWTVGAPTIDNSRGLATACTVATNVITCVPNGAGNGLPATLTLASYQLTVPAGTAAGDITLVIAPAAGSTVSTQTLTVASVVASGGVTATAYDAGTTGVATVYTGRTYSSGSNGGAIVDGIAVQEAVSATIANGSNVNLTMSGGAYTAGTNPTLSSATSPSCVGSLTLFPTTASAMTAATAGGYTGAPFVTAFTKGSGNWVTNANSTSTCAARNITFPSLIVGPTAGAVTATVNVPAIGDIATVTIANAVNATTSSVSGAAASLTAGSTSVALPTVVVTEYAKGALATTAGAPGTATFTLSNGTFNLSGNSAKWCGTALAASALTGGGTATLTATLPTVSTSTACTLELSGKMDVPVTAVPSTGVSIKVNSAGTDTAQATYQELVVGQVGTVTTAPVTAMSSTATATGSVTAQTITSSMSAATSDAGKSGYTFVILKAPAGVAGLTQDYYFSMNSSTIKQIGSGGCADILAYSQTTFSSSAISMPIVSTAMDLTTLKGLQIITGYGIGGLFSTAQSACENMLTNGTYAVSYTIQ